MRSAFSVPDEVEMLAFFGADALERSLADGYWCYEVADERGVTLRLSFKLFERSVQTALRIAGAPLATVAHEGAEAMTIVAETLTCRFACSDATTELRVRVSDLISVEWSSLRTR